MYPSLLQESARACVLAYPNLEGWKNPWMTGPSLHDIYFPVIENMFKLMKEKHFHQLKLQQKTERYPSVWCSSNFFSESIETRFHVCVQHFEQSWTPKSHKQIPWGIEYCINKAFTPHVYFESHQFIEPEATLRLSKIGGTWSPVVFSCFDLNNIHCFDIEFSWSGELLKILWATLRWPGSQMYCPVPLFGIRIRAEHVNGSAQQFYPLEDSTVFYDIAEFRWFPVIMYDMKIFDMVALLRDILKWTTGYPTICISPTEKERARESAGA